MIGRSTGAPIVLAPLTDALGLAITEGIEDALSVHEATGLGVWAAGSASASSTSATITERPRAPISTGLTQPSSTKIFLN